MTNSDVFILIRDRLQEAAQAKGAREILIDRETVILGGPLVADSLDLAAIVVELESVTGRDPFKDGFVNFRTVGQLADLYAE